MYMTFLCHNPEDHSAKFMDGSATSERYMEGNKWKASEKDLSLY
jgi:hypothetical protein